MKKLLFFTLSLALFGLSVNAQQCLPGGCTVFTNQYPTGTLTPTSSWQTHGTMNAGNWTLFSVTSGSTYEWTYCEAYGGVSTAWDAQLTLYNNTNLSSPICFSTDQCGTNSNAPYISWVATFTGTARILTTKYASGTGCQSNSGSPYNTLAYRKVASSCVGVTAVTTQPLTQSICSGSSVTLNVATNGDAPFSYFWYNQNGQISGANSSSYTTSTAGNYYCIITNCTNMYQVISNTATLTVTPIPPAPTSIDNGTPNVCSQSTTVDIGGLGQDPSYPPYNGQWVWYTGSCGGTQVGTGTDYYVNISTPGTFTYWLRAENSCGISACATTTVTVTQSVYATVNITASPSTSICTGTSVTFTAIAQNGGTSPSYQWKKNGSNIGTNSSTFTSSTLVNGDVITCILTSNATCEMDSPVTSNSLSISISNLNVSTSTTSANCGQSNGTATATPSGGTQPYSYLWTPGNQTSQTATGLSAGTYSVTVTDANGCSKTSTASISNPNSPSLTTSSTPCTATPCDGTATVTPSGGTQPYTYLWSPGNQTTQTATGLCNGTFSINVTDANNCTASSSAIISGNCGAGINENEINNFISIYPNPANSILTLEFSSFLKNNTAVFSIFSIDGKLIKSQNIKGSKTEINISDIAKGMYFLQIEDEHGVSIKKFTKE